MLRVNSTQFQTNAAQLVQTIQLREFKKLLLERLERCYHPHPKDAER